MKASVQEWSDATDDKNCNYGKFIQNYIPKGMYLSENQCMSGFMYIIKLAVWLLQARSWSLILTNIISGVMFVLWWHWIGLTKIVEAGSLLKSNPSYTYILSWTDKGNGFLLLTVF